MNSKFKKKTKLVSSLERQVKPDGNSNIEGLIETLNSLSTMKKEEEEKNNHMKVSFLSEKIINISENIYENDDYDYKTLVKEDNFEYEQEETIKKQLKSERADEFSDEISSDWEELKIKSIIGNEYNPYGKRKNISEEEENLRKIEIFFKKYDFFNEETREKSFFEGCLHETSQKSMMKSMELLELKKKIENEKEEIRKNEEKFLKVMSLKIN
jgi:hypothetical protein